LKRFKVFLVGS